MTIEEAIAIAKVVEETDESSAILTELQSAFPNFEWENLAHAHKVTKKILYRYTERTFKKVEKRTERERAIYVALLQMEEVIKDNKVFVGVRDSKDYSEYSEYELREETMWEW